MNKNTVSTLLKVMGWGTFMTGVSLAQGHSPTYSYPKAVDSSKQAQVLLKSAKEYLDAFNFETCLDTLSVYTLDLNPVETSATKNLNKQLARLKPYELGHFYCLFIQHLHDLNLDLDAKNVVVAWDGKNNTYMDRIRKKLQFEKDVSFDLKNVQTQRGAQEIYINYLKYWGQDSKKFPKRIFTLDQAQKFVDEVLNYLKVFNFETNMVKTLVKDKLSPVQRAEQTLYLLFKDVITQYNDYGRKYVRTVCLYFLHLKNQDWDEKNNIIPWDRKNNSFAETVSSEQFAGNEVRDMLLPKLQKYFNEASIAELKCLAPACAEWDCK